MGFSHDRHAERVKHDGGREVRGHPTVILTNGTNPGSRIAREALDRNAGASPGAKHSTTV